MFRGRGFDIGPIYLQHHGGGNSSLAWATFALVLLLVLAFGAVLIARAASRGPRLWQRRMAFAGGPPQGRLDPLELLRARYARGEISRDEFLQGTSDLASSAPSEERPPETG
jgi:uncharacterized membrane protein